LLRGGKTLLCGLAALAQWLQFLAHDLPNGHAPITGPQVIAKTAESLPSSNPHRTFGDIIENIDRGNRC
jgi:hypothetical protein